VNFASPSRSFKLSDYYLVCTNSYSEKFLDFFIFLIKTLVAFHFVSIIRDFCIELSFFLFLMHVLNMFQERSLQNITNYFIVSLAVADLLVAGVVMPFYTYTLVGLTLEYTKLVLRQNVASHNVYII
jgi:hypothetical protein